MEYFCVDPDWNMGRGVDAEAAYNSYVALNDDGYELSDLEFYKAEQIEVRTSTKVTITEVQK